MLSTFPIVGPSSTTNLLQDSPDTPETDVLDESHHSVSIDKDTIAFYDPDDVTAANIEDEKV